MPNWCVTNITVRHDKDELLKDLFDKIEQWASANYSDNGYRTGWLGNIIGNSGIGQMTDDKSFDYECDGFIVGMEFIPGHSLDAEIHISTETAWHPMMEMWIALCDRYLPGADIIYIAEEPGMGLYVTNDASRNKAFCLEVYDDLIDVYNENDYQDTMECIEEDEGIELMQAYLDSTETDPIKLMNAFNRAYSHAALIHQWEYVETPTIKN